jgi:transposase
MKPVNRYCRFSKISEDKFRFLVRCFIVHDLTATETAKRAKLSVRSVNPLFLRFRVRIMEIMDELYPDNWEALRWLYNSLTKVEADDLWYGQRAARMKKFYGISSGTEYMHVRETEFRFINAPYVLYEWLLRDFEKYPL